MVYDMMTRKKVLKIQDRLGMRIGIPYGTHTIPIVRNRIDVFKVFQELYRLGLKAFVLPKELFAGIETATDLYKTWYGELLKIKDEAKRLNIELSLHYPNLPEIPDEILKIYCTIASIMDCRLFIIQPNFYRRMPADQALKLTIYKINEIVTELRTKAKIGIEVSGKSDELGDLEDVVEIVKRTTNTEPVLNWAHLHARGAGAIRSQKDIRSNIDYINRAIGPTWLKSCFFLFSGVSYSLKGEIAHIPYAKSDLNLEWLIRECMASGARGTLIFEDPERDKFVFGMIEKLADMVR
jgi:endonuclease IV